MLRKNNISYNDIEMTKYLI